jgi:acyl carrier protein
MKERIKKAMAATFMIDAAQIADNISQSNFESWESLQHLMLMVNIENEFNVSFDPEEIVEMTSLELIEQHLQKKLATS